MSEETLDILVGCLGLAWLVGMAILGGSRTAGSGITAVRAARAWPWVVGLPAVLILSCLAYFLFGRP